MRSSAFPTFAGAMIICVLGCSPKPSDQTPAYGKQTKENADRKQSTDTGNGVGRVESELSIEDYLQPRVDPFVEDRFAPHPLLRQNEWMTIDGEMLGGEDKVAEERPLEIESIVEEWELNGGTVIIDDENNIKHVQFVHMKFNEPKKLVDPGLVLLKRIPNLRAVQLFNVPATDNGIRHLSEVTTLETLEFAWTDISDAGLSYLQDLTAVEMLGLAHTAVTDAGLVHLKRMSKLRVLVLNGTDVTDDGLVHLERLTNLEELSLYSTDVTEEGVSRLESALPGCSIAR